jgi:hypothetical protein
VLLQTSGTASFISDGAGGTVATVQMGPQRYGENWSVNSSSISTTSALPTSCRMYRNMVSPSAFLDGTASANLNVSNVPVELQSLDKLIFVFTGGTMGSAATVVLNGSVNY